MPSDETISIIVGCAMFVFMALVITVTIVVTVRSRRKFFFTVHSHEVVVQVRPAGVTLFVDGREEDAFAAQNISVATLRAQIDGEEFKARMTRRGFKCAVEATYGGREAVCVNVTK